ncbi:MAG: RpiB/LacA/LacB family sugar-phosphate isomerase [Alphaproteobacteria bacterium]|nr:MAG: RpiB/LacA/LacB family sugar-phosphate isomerase [Alphaproteobacteria bacterium]
MKIYIANDHAGYNVKKTLLFVLEKYGEVIDLGADSSESSDYPIYAKKLADHIDDGSRGILLCGSGIGICMAANRFKHIRAAVCHSVEEVTLARHHNNINVLCLAARSQDPFAEIIDGFFRIPFLNEERHVRRLALISS